MLVPGATVYANYDDNPNRSTKYDLVAVEKGDLLIDMDSYAPNIAFGEYLQKGKFLRDVTHIKSEAKYGASRFDFHVETATNKAFIEAKGVTLVAWTSSSRRERRALEENGIAMFPDAPTARGIKHLNELAACMADGYNVYVVSLYKWRG